MNNTVAIQVGTFPGRLETFAVDVGTSITSVISMAGLGVGAEQDIKMDGEIVSPSDVVTEDTRLVLITKRIKGAR